MTTLTYTIKIPLPENEFERGALVAKCAPLRDRLATILLEIDAPDESTVAYTFDGRKARAPKTTSAAPPSNGADASVARGAARGEG